jgi:hypothetical protein
MPSIDNEKMPSIDDEKMPSDEKRVDDNLEMPPLVADLPLMGSSRISGGFSCGLSHGNVPNHADFNMSTLELGTPIKGEVSLYVTDQYPRDINFDLLKGESEMVVMVGVVKSMALVLEKVARKVAMIKSECPIYFYDSLNMKLNLDRDCNIYYRKSTKWIALGSFDQAMEEDDDCEWGVSDGTTPELHLLIVSFQYMFT